MNTGNEIVNQKGGVSTTATTVNLAVALSQSLRRGLDEATQREIAALHAVGVPIHQIAKRLDVSYGTAWNDARRSEQEHVA